MKPIRVLLADDHTLVRGGLRSLLHSFGGIEIVAEAGNGQDALASIETHHPEVVLMDVAMPVLNGVEALRCVVKQWPEIRVLMLSVHTDAECVLQVLRCGAAGYLVKDAAVSELEMAVRAVARGEIYLSPAIARQVITGCGVPLDRAASPFERLTPRHRQILQLVAEGHTTKEIARTLTISAKTVENHRAQLMERLDIHDVAGLARYAVRAGLVDPNR